MTAGTATGEENLFLQYVVPLVATYALFVMMLVAYARRRGPATRPDGVRQAHVARRASWGRLLRLLLITSTAGYLTFLAIVGLYYWLLVRQSRLFIQQAVTGGAFLAYGVAVPAFLVLSWLEEVFLSRSSLKRRR